MAEIEERDISSNNLILAILIVNSSNQIEKNISLNDSFQFDKFDVLKNILLPNTILNSCEKYSLPIFFYNTFNDIISENLLSNINYPMKKIFTTGAVYEDHFIDDINNSEIVEENENRFKTSK